MSEEWPVVDSRVEWRTPFFEAGVDVVERPGGERGEYYWLEPPDGVVVVAVEGDDLVLVEGYRPRPRARFLELPGGSVEPGESPAETGRRELREETGFEAGTVELVGSYAPSAWLRMTQHVAFATDLRAGEPSPEDGEFLDVCVLPLADARDRIRAGPTAAWALTPLLLAREAGYLPA